MTDGNVVGAPSLGLGPDLLATVLGLVWISWGIIVKNKKVNVSSREEPIRDQLVIAMREEKRRQKLQLRVQPEAGSQSQANAGSPLGRIDIMIIYSWDDDEYLTLECKRVTGDDADLARLYTTDGICRFVRGTYSPRHEFGVMLGFVMDSDIAGSVKRVTSYLGSCTDAELVDAWRPEASFGPAVRNAFRSSHRQSSLKSQIVLIHTFLPLAA